MFESITVPSREETIHNMEGRKCGRDRETGAGRGGWGGSGKEEERNFHSIKRHKTSLSVCCNYQISPL